MIVKRDIEQGTPAWMELHGSVPSASNFSKVVKMNGEPSDQRHDYMMQLAGTRVWGVYEDSYQSWNMKRGIELEPVAKRLYSLVTGNEIEDVGFCYYDERMDRGASPDSLIITGNGVLEVKSPLLKTHVKYMLKGTLPSEYFQQVHGEMYVASSEWAHFMSFFPGAPEFIVKVERDEKFISLLDRRLDEFNAELDALTERLRNK